MISIMSLGNFKQRMNRDFDKRLVIRQPKLKDGEVTLTIFFLVHDRPESQW